MIVCPLCRQPLVPDGASHACAAGHRFDQAREGYLNLLPVQHRRSRAPGDNTDMVRARRAFLDAGHYRPLRDAVMAILGELAPQRLLDIGCGEGYYTQAMADAVPAVTGIDIARDAVRLAARRDARVRWLVAGSARLPLADHSIDAACSLFSPLPVAELLRVLVPGGHLLVATPAPDHLQALRAVLFDEVRPHRPDKFIGELAPALQPAGQREIRFPMVLDRTAREQLLTMTPYGWRASPARRLLLCGPASAETMTVSAAFSLLVFRAGGNATPAA